MNTLKIGDRQLIGDQIVSALVQYKLLEPLVGQILLDDAVQQVPLTEAEVFHALGGTADIPSDLKQFVGQWCQQMGVTPAYFKGVVLRELKVEKFKQLQFGRQVEAAFLQMKAELDQVEYSYFRIASCDLAQELYFQLRDDQVGFEALAMKYGMQAGTEQEVKIGPVSLSSLPAQLIQLFRNAQENVVYPPILIEQQFWIVKLDRFSPARLTEATRAALLNRLYTQWMQSQVNHLMSQPDAIKIGIA
jgi:hypothetical protein